MPRYAKQLNCPTSATLSACGTGTLSFLARQSVAEHLAACEFCGAELALLLAQQPARVVERSDALSVTAPPPMPLALRVLAESILGELHFAERRAA